MMNVSKASNMTAANHGAMPKSSCNTHVPPMVKRTTTAQCASFSNKSAKVAFQRASIAQAYPGNGADLNRPAPDSPAEQRRPPPQSAGAGRPDLEN